ncbi:universal stress protein [Myxacorys almedinensis]|uniref:Universal stress protein n=1 Tax=Myxacorys almedinensis A TaxID=2690445 RepID=A0A8J7Z0K6_9CYAN|nr:universal stress protein [Myxacorys almedinensis]NDJ17499.1 universal stress protein [Myxacorys almedinensis A]
MLESIIWILLLGFFVGQLVRRLKVPALVGMILVGIGLGSHMSNTLSPTVLNAAGDLRIAAVMIILMKAGLGLDREKLAQQGTVALRLGFLPASLEAVAIALTAIWIFGFDFSTGSILAVAALSILVTAPLGAWAIPAFAPRLLQRGEIDPTKVSVTSRVVLLAAIDTSLLATHVLTKVAELARRSDAEVIVLHVANTDQIDSIEQLQARSHRLLSDIRHQFITASGTVPEQILQAAHAYQVTEIVMGKRGYQPWQNVLVGSVSQAVLESSSIPVVVVEARRTDGCA